MRKFLILLTLSFLPVTLKALPLGNPADAGLLYNGILTGLPDPMNCCFFDNYKLKLGYYGDFVIDRKLEVDRGDNSNIHQTKIRTNAGYLAVTLCDWAEVFSTLGVSRIDIISTEKAWGGTTGGASTFTYLLFDTSFSWSIGARGKIWECGDFLLGIEGQYFLTHPHLVTYRLEERVPQYLDFRLKYHEWQVGVGVSYWINIGSCLSGVVPYAGVKWSSAFLSTGDAQSIVGESTEDINTFFDMRSRRRWGYAVGVTFVGSATWSISGEVRFIDERAISLITEFVF